MTRVKICGLTSLRDVEKALELGADALGFIHEPSSPRFVGDQRTFLVEAARMAGIVPTFAVYGPYRKDSLSPMSHLQAEVVGTVVDRPLLRVFKVPVEASASQKFQIIEEFSKVVKEEKTVDSRSIGFLLDAKSGAAHGGTGLRIDEELAVVLRSKCQMKLILAGGLNPENVFDAIQAVRPDAVDVSSGVESSPGVKDHAKMKDFMEAVRANIDPQ